MKQKIITARTARELNSKMQKEMEDGWEPLGSHQVAVVEEYAQYAGNQYRRTIRENEFSQTMVKK